MNNDKRFNEEKKTSENETNARENKNECVTRLQGHDHRCVIV